VIEARAPDGLADLPKPDAIFIGGGLGEPLLETLRTMSGTRLVANAVTLESEALLASWHARKGGELLRIELATASPLGAKRGWRSSIPSRSGA
jgi:precorrin-6Y C5,15-methyltransferase (decarboxylating)